MPTRNPLISEAKTEAKIPTSIKMIGKRDFFSTSNAINMIGTEIETNKT
jgi:hypothetical protein